MEISVIIERFLKQNIQSEAEVRSKLIVPLLEELGYPSELRAEEFPVYGYDGGKESRSKAADFIQFTSNEFDKNRDKSKKEWVYKHSLLVFEAKKPTEKVLVKGQPIFYSTWTKSIAYIISNGINIEGYIVNANYEDKCVFSCNVEDIPKEWDKINLLNYENIKNIKKDASKKYENLTNDIYEKYKNYMLVKTTKDLCNCVDRNIEEVEYGFEFKEGSKKINNYKDLIDNQSKIIVSEAGGGKSYLMKMIMKEYLSKNYYENKKIPILLEGRYYGKGYNSLVDGIFDELSTVLSFINKDIIRKKLNKGEFIILFDGLDEAEIDYDNLIYEFKIIKNTNNIVIITSRKENYKGELKQGFSYYVLEKLNNQKIDELLRISSNNEINIFNRNIPKNLIEIIRTPLFLKMFISISKQDNIYKIPKNYSALFELYIESKLNDTRISFYEKKIIKDIFSEYAFFSYENGDSTEKFYEILCSKCNKNKLDIGKIDKKIWASGIITEGLQGIKYFHKSIQEFLVSFKLSTLEKEELFIWLEKNSKEEKYYEIISYLTGIISNKDKQNVVLDYLEKHNLKLFIKALESRRNFENDQTIKWDEEYAKNYCNQILKTYKNIIKTFFYNIRYIFDGYKENNEGFVNIYGRINFIEKNIRIIIDNNSFGEDLVDVKLIYGKSDINIISEEKTSPILAAVFPLGDTQVRYYNLKRLEYGFDSSREIAIDIIKRQIGVAFKNMMFLDKEIEVLMLERIENHLEEINNKGMLKDNNINLTLYKNNINEIIDMLSEVSLEDEKIYSTLELCDLVKNSKLEVEKFLDIKPNFDLLGEDFTEENLYSNEDIVNKLKRIIYLSQKAIKKIVESIIPILSTVRDNSLIIADLHKSNVFNISGFSINYIKVKIYEEEIQNSIIEFNANPKEVIYELDNYYKEKLNMINKNESNILSRHSSVLGICLDNNIFHKIIYKEIKRLLKNLMGDL